MGWVYLDDHFDEHPKFLTAGEDASWMFVKALAYCKRNRLRGRIHREMVPRLINKPKPFELAKRLVAAGLWEVDGDVFVIHDWDEWNKFAEVQETRGRKGAEARWGKARPPEDGCSSNARAMPEHPSSNGHASAKHGASNSQVPVPKDLSQSPVLPTVNATSRNDEIGDRSSKDGDEQRKDMNPLDRLEAVCEGRSPAVIHNEAIAVIAWARKHVDDRLIHEAIAYLETAAKKPSLPRAAVTVIQRKAADKRIQMPDFPLGIKRFE